MTPDSRPPVAVSWNRWIDIPAQKIGYWEPDIGVSVVVPYYEQPDELALTLAGLSQQSYPQSLLQVIVVDDGSSSPPEISSTLPLDLELVRQRDEGYGLARARNLGAKVAEGDVVIFLDCDMIPERQHVEAHARWHSVNRRLVTIGFRNHAQFSGLGEEEVAAAVRDGTLPELLTGQEWVRPEWIEAHMERTEHLLTPLHDLYLVTSGGNLGVDRDLFWEAGGVDASFVRWGGEDNEMGYRLLQLGAVVVPERDAIAWHQGEGHIPSPEEQRSLRLQIPKMRQHIADRSIRPSIRGRSYLVPRMAAHVGPASVEVEKVGLTIDSLLASNFSDLVVGVAPVEDPVDSVWLEETYTSDPRVHLHRSIEEMEQLFPWSPLRLAVPGGVFLASDSLDRLVEEVSTRHLGALHITLPGQPLTTLASLRLTRAVNRARALDPAHEDVTIGLLFGERWVSGKTFGLWEIKEVNSARTSLAQGSQGSIRAGFQQQITQLEHEISSLRSRRALRIADALGTIVKARSVAELRFGVSALRTAVSGGGVPDSQVEDRVDPGSE